MHPHGHASAPVNPQGEGQPKRETNAGICLIMHSDKVEMTSSLPYTTSWYGKAQTISWGAFQGSNIVTTGYDRPVNST